MEQPELHPPDTTPPVASASTSRRSSLHIPRKTSWGDPISPPSSFEAHRPNISQEKLFEDVDLESSCHGSITSTHVKDRVTLHDISTLGLSFSADDNEISRPIKSRFPLEDSIEFLEQASKERGAVPALEHHPYNKYLKNLRRMGAQRRKTVSCDIGSSLLEKELSNVSGGTSGVYTHKKSSSGSSFGFVTAVKSASISLASFSVAPRSRRTAISSHHTRADHSRASNAPRVSEDSTYIARSVVIDQAVTNRLLHRRRILEEIISTEESYVADVRFLRNVYVTLLASMPPISQSLRASINHNLNEIVGLHDEILGELHRAVPHSEYTQRDYMDPKPTPKSHGHNRWRSLDGVAANIGVSLLQKIPGMTAEPKVAAEVARVFGRKMNRLFIYEEYGAKYEMMIRDISTAHRTMPQWEMYQKGLEALASSLASINNQFDASKKALTVGDLLVKPIQRVCKYPLLFVELLKQTPVCDCPESHGEIDSVLVRLREATTEINRATDDPRMKVTMEKTWLLQDRLQFPEKPSSLSKNIMRSLGHIHLCGVLHGSWQTKDSVDGQYLVCLMYRDFLVLATAHPKVDNIYLAQACIALSQIRVEDVDNGRGLQCHTAPFSWKLVFEFDHRMFEITMSACSPKEELEWRSRLVDRASKEPLDAGEEVEFTSLSLAIKPMGTVFGKPGTIARRISIHRATTVGPLTGLCQVIIRNTNAFKEIPHSASFSSSCTSINRSQSLLTTNRIPILSPSRAERIRLESMLADVWTRDVLPFPGMTGRARSEHLVRSSASSMMRKLSKASITSNFTKRSSSVTSLKMASEEEEEGIGGEQHATAAEHLNGDPKPHEHTPSRLAAIVQNEEKRFHEASVDSRPNSPAGNNKRFETVKLKKNQWAHDCQKTITPPPRTSSANSWSASQGNLTEAIRREEKENLLHELHGTKHKKLRKGSGKRTTSLVAESIRNFFR